MPSIGYDATISGLKHLKPQSVRIRNKVQDVQIGPLKEQHRVEIVHDFEEPQSIGLLYKQRHRLGHANSNVSHHLSNRCQKPCCTDIFQPWPGPGQECLDKSQANSIYGYCLYNSPCISLAPEYYRYDLLASVFQLRNGTCRKKGCHTSCKSRASWNEYTSNASSRSY